MKGNEGGVGLRIQRQPYGQTACTVNSFATFDCYGIGMCLADLGKYRTVIVQMNPRRRAR